MRSCTDRAWRAALTRTGSAALLLAGVSCLASGCNIAGPALWFVSDDRDPALYKLDPKRTAVVFIDDRSSVLPARILRDRISKGAEKQILEQKLLDVDLVSSDSLQQVVAGERFSKPRSIAEVGKAVQADQVIYATVDSFTLSPDGSQHAPTATIRVKVIDSKRDVRVFPADESPGTGGGKDAAYTLVVPEKVRATGLPHSTAEIMKEQQELADEVGRRLGQLFYKHSTRDPNSPVGRS
jgi:hypothetical protein